MMKAFEFIIIPILHRRGVSLRRLLDAALAALVTETDPEDEVAMVALPSASATTTAATVVGAEEETAILIAAQELPPLLGTRRFF